MNEDFSQGYHSRADTVYHTDPNCPIGRRIPREWLVAGTGPLALCPTCRMRADAHPAGGTYVRPAHGSED